MMLRKSNTVSQPHSLILIVLMVGVLVITFSGCGKAQSTASGVIVQSAPMAGPSAASLGKGFPQLALEWLSNLVGERVAYAAVSTFTSFKACNDTLIFIDSNGNQVSVNGSANPSVGRGLLTFSPTSQSAMTIGNIALPVGTSLSEIDITFAVVPSVCGGANYAVEFDPGTGPIDVTQNTAFKFKYASPLVISGNAQTVTLMFGAIVNSMVAKGAGLNNSTIQSAAVLGAAQ